MKSTPRRSQIKTASNTFAVFWRKEKYRFFAGLISTTLAILIALLINSAVKAQSEQYSYDMMIKAIKAEARGNKDILRNSFLPNYSNGLVLRSFDDSYAQSCMKQELFIKNADNGIVNVLTSYKLAIQRANAFRDLNERYWFSKDTETIWWKQQKLAWLYNMIEVHSLLRQIENYQR